ncbi:MAG: response regulator [Deltaproteobacteria bacterium]|nr:response regulator [Deltaproteobacteria bacterium]
MTEASATILVVDDEPKNVKLLEAHLIPQGYQVVRAYSGKEALEQLAKQPIDLVLLDVMMPEMDGFAVTKQIRKHRGTRLIPIILVTALSSTEDRVRGIEAGCDDFISKPFEASEVLARVKTLLRMNYFRSLLDEKEKFEYVMDRAPLGIVLLSPKFQLENCNKKAMELLGLNKQNLPKNFTDFLTSQFQIPSGQNLRGILLYDSTFELERPETKEFRPLILSLHSSPIRNPVGELTTIILLLTDITESRRKEFTELKFLDLISHKLRTPMMVIDGYANLLKDGVLGPLSEKQQEAVHSVWDKSSELIHTFEKQLGILGIHAGKARQHEATLGLSAFFQEKIGILKKLFERQFPDKKIELSYPSNEVSLTLRVNSEYFELIIKSLLENALKFNANVQAQVQITMEKREGELILAVTDNGMGIPPEEQEKIFELFYQIDKFRTGNVKGHGLGLTLVSDFMTALGGKTEVKSQIGKGSTFSLHFPISSQ